MKTIFLLLLSVSNLIFAYEWGKTERENQKGREWAVQLMALSEMSAKHTLAWAEYSNDKIDIDSLSRVVESYRQCLMTTNLKWEILKP